ncbi:MAG: helix-turn-helix transcriptional regulator [Lysobacteraceae bacterium]
MELEQARSHDSTIHLIGFDASAQSPPVLQERIDADDARSHAAAAAERLHRGHVMLDNALLRQLRQARLMSQQDLADDCWRRNVQLSLTTIKRAEAGRAVRFRIAREFARCFDVPVTRIVRTGGAIAVLDHDAP